MLVFKRLYVFSQMMKKKEKTVYIRVKKKKKNVLNYHKMGVWGRWERGERKKERENEKARRKHKEILR